jgi:alpha-galactosidase
LTNRDVIALNQDQLGIQAFRALADGSIEIWAKPLANNEWAVAFLNRGDTARGYSYSWKNTSISDALTMKTLATDKLTYTWSELWTKAKGDTRQDFKQVIAAHAVVVYRLVPTDAGGKDDVKCFQCIRPSLSG